jgi:hypothetical protein
MDAVGQVDNEEALVSGDTVWITFDLGARGDYKGLYSWLDAHGARECGERVAILTYPCAGSLPDKLKEDLKKSISIDGHTSIYVIYPDPATAENRGTFIFGERRVPVWTGYSASQPEAGGWRRYPWTPPCGTVFQVRAATSAGRPLSN